MTKPVTCLFLGSGASYALAGIPIQRDFLCSVLTEERAEWVDTCEKEPYRLKIGGVPISSWMLDVGDIELCMSHLHHIAYADPLPEEPLPPGPRRHAVRALVNLRAAIADYLKGFEPTNEIKENFCNWIASLTKNGRSLVILTTNYDLVLEKLLSNTQYHYPKIPTTETTEQNGIPIYKLHGSINWLEERAEDGTPTGGNQPTVYIPDEILPVADKADKVDAWLYRLRIHEKIYSLILIAFFFQKDDWLKGRWEKIFTPHWKSAQDLLENRLERFYFLGYSLPPADQHIMSWLLQILQKQENKPKIRIVCKGEDERLEKVLKPFQPRICRCGLERFLEDHV